MGKLPAFQFYPGDWVRDSISGCTLAAQGLWLRMILLMHDSDRYGYLSVNGSPIPPESIARRCGCTLEQYESLLAELETNGAPSRTPEGIIFSRRMVRDAQEREEWRALAVQILEDPQQIPTSWRAIRELILHRDLNLCGYCGAFADTVDHILPKSRGGNNHPKNLIAACRHCNYSKNDRTPEEVGYVFMKEEHG